MQVTTINEKLPQEIHLGVVYASVESVNSESFDECISELKEKAEQLGAERLIGLQLVQSQGQWNRRTSLLATAVKTGA